MVIPILVHQVQQNCNFSNFYAPKNGIIYQNYRSLIFTLLKRVSLNTFLLIQILRIHETNLKILNCFIFLNDFNFRIMFVEK